MEKFNDHSELPFSWTTGRLYNLCFQDKQECTIICSDDILHCSESDADFIVEACNNYYQLKEENQAMADLITEMTKAHKKRVTNLKCQITALDMALALKFK